MSSLDLESSLRATSDNPVLKTTSNM